MGKKVYGSVVYLWEWGDPATYYNINFGTNNIIGKISSNWDQDYKFKCDLKNDELFLFILILQYEQFISVILNPK